MTATLTKWYEEHGRHDIYAGGKAVHLPTTAHSLRLNEAAVAAGAQTDLDAIGVAKNAREEKMRARAAKKQASPQDEQMRQLYQKHVLKMPDLIQIRGLKKSSEESSETKQPELVN